MIKKLFNSQINSVTIAAILVAFFSLLSRLLGLLRDRIFASEFGAGDTLDVYYAAFRVPDTIFNLLVLGALSAGFIPIFARLINDPLSPIKNFFSREKNQPAWRLANNVINLLGLFLLLLSALGVLATPWLVKIIAPGFGPDKQALVAHLTRIMFLSPLFLGLSSVFGGVLQSFKRFFVYALAPVFYNLGIIAGALFFVPAIGPSGLAWGVVAGALAHLLVQIPAAWSLGYRYQPIIDWTDKNIRQIGALMGPRTLSLAVTQINLFIITIIASVLPGGSLAIFSLANNLQSFPVGVFGISYAIAAFPALSVLAFKKDELVRQFSSTLRNIMFFIIPATIIFLSLRAQIVRIIFGAGQFNWRDTELTMETLGFFAISLFAQATLPLISRVFFARHDTKTPLYAGLATTALNLVLSWFFARRWGVAGLALAFSLANIFNFIFLWTALRLELGFLDEKRVLTALAKLTAAAVVLGAVIQGVKIVIWPFIDMTRLWGVVLQGGAAGLFGLIAYGVVAALLKSEEFFDFWQALRRRLPWKKVPVSDQGEARGI